MTYEEEIIVRAELSEEFKAFEEFCAENSGREQDYLQLVSTNPLDMDSVTLAFCLRHMLRLAKNLMEIILKSLGEEESLSLTEILETKGIQLDKSRSAELRSIIFAFRDSNDDAHGETLVRAFQLMTIGRERKRIKLITVEAYDRYDEGWMAEDFGGDESLLETVRAIEDPHWSNSEE